MQVRINKQDRRWKEGEDRVDARSRPGRQREVQTRVRERQRVEGRFKWHRPGEEKQESGKERRRGREKSNNGIDV